MNEDVARLDPLTSLYLAQPTKKQLAPVNLRALTPFQRSLLAIDGTVTKFIEAYMMEPVDVIRLNQETRALTADHTWLKAPAGTEVIGREVLLQGRYTDTVYAYAASLIVPERLKGPQAESLEINEESLGRILLASRMETYRDILWYGKEEATALPPALHHLTKRELFSRTYCIVGGGQPIMLINEKFLSDIERFPSLV
jgi:chorismate lyase